MFSSIKYFLIIERFFLFSHETCYISVASFFSFVYGFDEPVDGVYAVLDLVGDPPDDDYPH